MQTKAYKRTKIKWFATLVLLLGLLQVNLIAQKSWDGGASTTNWGDAANWLPDGVPASTDDVTIGSGFTVNVNTTTATCKALVIDGTLLFPATSGRILTVTGDLSGTGAIDMSAAVTGTINFQGLNHTLGTFSAGTSSTIVYNGTSSQNIAPWNYYNLSLGSTSSTKTLMGNTSIAGTFLMNTGTFSCGTNNLTLSGTVTYTAGVLTTGANLVTYNNSSAQNVIRGTYGGDLLLSGGTKTFVNGVACSVTGTFSMNASVAAGAYNLTLNGPVVYTSGTFSTSGATLSYTGLGSQNIISGSIGGNLTLSGGDKTIVTAANPLIVSSTFTMGANLNCGNNNVTLSGTVTYTSGTLSNGINLFSYNGGTQNLIGATYNQLTLSGSGTKTIITNPVVVNDAMIMSVSLACGTNNLTLNGTVSNTAGSITTGSNTVTYARTGDQNLITGTYSGSMVFTGSGNRNQTGAISVASNLTIPTNIIYNTNNYAATVSGNLTIDAGGRFNINSTSSGSASLLLGSAKTITNNGIFEVLGTATYPAIVTRTGAGTYSYVQSASTATILAKYYQFNYLNGGINITDGTIDPTYNFSNGSFSSGIGTQYLTVQNIDLSSLPTISSIVFNSGPTYNVTRTTGTGAINFLDATGTLAGENYDNDDSNPGTHINWSFPGTTFYSNPNGTFSAGLITNWTTNADGTGSNPSNLTDGTASLIIQDGHTVTLDATNGNINVKEIQVGQGTSGTLLIGNTTAQRTLTIQQKLDIRNGGTVKAGSIGTTNHQILLYGNIYNAGSLMLYTATGYNVNLLVYGTSSSIQGSSVPVLNNITFKSGSKSETLVSLDIEGNVILESTSTFSDGGQTINIKGNWTESGSAQRTGTGTTIFNGTINSIINGGSSAGTLFNNLVFNGGGAGSITDVVTVNGYLSISNNTTVQSSANDSIKGHFSVDYGSTFTQTANTTYIKGTAAQSVYGGGTVTFNALVLMNGGTNSKTVTGTINVSGSVSILSGSTTDGNANWIIAGGVRLDGICNWNGTVKLTGGTIQTYNASNTASLGTAELYISGYVYLGYTSPATAFQLIVGGNVNIQSGYLVLQTGTFLVGGAAYAFNLASGTSLYVRGADNFPTGFGSINMNSASTTYYDWNLAQVVRGGLTYGTLVIDDNSSTSTWIKTADNFVNVGGSLYLRGATTFALNGYALNVTGTAIYNGTNSSIDGPTSTLTMNAGDASQTIQSSGTGSYNLKDLIFTLDGPTASRTKYIASGAVFNLTGNFSVTNVNGTTAIQHILDIADINMNGSPVNFNLGSNCQLNTTNTSFGSNFMDKFTGSKTLDITSTVYYSLSGNQSVADGFTYGNIIFNTGNKTAEGPLDINGKIAVGTGTPVFYDAGFTHTVAGDWNLGTSNYTFSSATGTIVLDGYNQNVSSTNFNNLIVNNYGIATLLGTVNIRGDLTMNDNSQLDGNLRTINLYGNWVCPGTGKFTQTTAGYVYFVGTANQTFQTNLVSTFGNVYLNKPNAAGAQTVTLLSDLNVSNYVYLTSNAGIFNISGHTVYIGGRLYVYSNTVETGLTFISDNSSVVFNGSLNQYIYNDNTNPLTFNNITFEGAGTKYVGWSGIAGRSNLININGNVNINGSSFAASGWTYVQNYYVKGDWTNTGTFTHSSGNTVYFDGKNQTISTTTFGSVAFKNNGNKNLTGNISASGNLTIGDTANLIPNGYGIKVTGNWVNSDPLSKFTSANETVTFEGSTTSNIYTGTTTGPVTGKSFYNIVENKTAGYTVALAGDADINNDLVINSGYFTTNTYDIWLAGNLNNAGGIFNHNNSSSLITLDGNGGTKIFNPGSNATSYPLRGITVNAPGTTYQVSNNFIINQNVDFTLTDGYFDLNAHQLQLNTNLQKIVINGGTFDVDAGSTLIFNGTSQSISNNGGTLRIVGTSIANAVINKASGTYTINQTAGTFHAGYYKISSPSAITLSGGNLDATDNFSDGTFSSGISGTAYLTLTGLNCGDIVVSNAVFNSGATYNVRRLSGTGTVTFADATGTLAGETYDDDGGNPGSVVWTNPGGFYWDGGAGTTSWHDAANWSGDKIPDSTNNVYLNHKYVTTAYTVDINTDNAFCSRLVLDAQGGTAVGLRLQNGYDLKATGSVVINTSTSIIVANTTSNINVGGNWSNVGTFTHGNSTVIFDGTNSSYTISSGGVGTGKSFYNLEINATGSTYSLANVTDIDNNFNLTTGTFDLASPSNDITVGGNWNVNTTNGGVFIPSTADVTFDGTTQTINNGPFYNFLTAGSGTKTLLSNVAVDGTVTIASGTTLNAAEINLFVGVNWVNNGGSFTQSGLGLVNFYGTGTQQVDYGTTTTTFYNTTFSNAGAKYINKACLFNGDFIVNAGSGAVDVYTYQITGKGTNSFILGNSTTFRLRGTNNFPTNFATYTLSSSSTVDYYSDLDQTIKVSPAWNYGNLRVSDATTSSPSSIKTAEAGNLTITGSLYVNDIRTQLNMATNSTNMTLTGSISFPTGGIQINWGTGSSTITHIGTDWYIDGDITGFNHMVFAGSGDKWTVGNLAITGNVTVKNGVTLRMQEGWGPPPVPHTMTGLAGKTFTMENGAALVCPVAETTSPAFAIGFGTYTLAENSTVTLNGYDNQIIYTGNNIIYGNLNLGGYNRNVTMDGVANLDVNGYFNSNYANLYDAGKSISVAGTYAYVNYYTPSSTSTFTLDGSSAQGLYDVLTGTTSNTTFDFNKVIFSGSGIKTFGDGNDDIYVLGDLNVSNGVTVISGRNITFSGTNWVNSGYFQHTANTVTFNSTSDQNITPGTAGTSNYFYNLAFSNSSVKTFKVNGTDINGSVTINAGTVNLGNYSYYIAGSITNTSGGILKSASSNLTFDGGNQNINSPAFEVNNVIFSNSGTKRMFSDWNIYGNLTINNTSTFNTSDGVLPTYYNIFIRGNWTNNGTFTSNTSKVTFNGSTTPISITSNGSNFYDAEFVPTASTQYNLLSATNRISRRMDLRSLATLNLNSTTLILGSNIASGKLYTIEGNLNVNENAILKFNSQTSQSVMNVTGSLKVVGTSATQIATITRETAGVTGAEAQINILSGGTLGAKYYLIEYLQDAGLIMATGSTLDATNNLSYGRFSNIRNASNVCYLNTEATYTGGTITNINFDYSGTPTQGVHFNVRRNTAATPLIFDIVGGNLGSYKFEDDEASTPAAGSGLLQWPAITATTWIGGISTNWHTAGNWSDGVPTLLIDAIVPTGSPNDAYITDANAVCKNLNITTGRVLVQNGNRLTASGDIYIGSTGSGILSVGTATSTIECGGYWTRGTNGMFIHGNGTVYFTSAAGTANITPLTSPFYNIVIDNTNTTFNLIGGASPALTIKGSVDIKNGTLVPATNAYTYNVEGDFTVESGTFLPIANTVTSGTVVFNGSSTQNITNATFYNLTIAGANTKATHGPIIINNQATISSTLKAESGSNIDFNGNVLIDPSGTFNDGNETHTFTGLTWTGTGGYLGDGTIIFDRTSSDQSVYASKFANLDIACKQRALYFYGNVDITGNTVIRDSVVSIYFNNFLLTSTAAAGNFKVENNANLILTGSDVFPSGFSSYDLANTSNTYYRGSSNQLIAGVNYGILTLQNTNTKTLKGDIGIQNTLYFNTSTLDVSDNNFAITVSGTWNNSNTGTFIPHNGEVKFDGSGNSQYIYVGTTATNPFWDLTEEKPSGTLYAGSGVTYNILDNLTVNSGTFNANGRPVEIANNMIASNTGVFAQSGTFTLTKPSSTANLKTNGSILNNLIISGGSSSEILVLDNLRVDGYLTVNSGTFNGNGKYIQLGYSGNTVGISGTYKVGPGGTLALGYNCGLTVNTGGIFDAVGTSSSSASVTRNVNYYYGGGYKFTVNGTIKAQYALFDYMGGQSNGIYISSTGIIDPSNNFSNCTFNNGSSTGSMLTIENNQSFTGTGAIMNVTFPTNPGGSGKNVRKVVATSGTVEFYNAIGVFAGESYDDDPYNLINWTGPISLTWNGTISTDWFTAGNWTASSGPGFVPTGAENVYIATALNQPILNTYGALTAHLTINSGATLTLNTPEDAATNDLNIQGDIIINGTLREVSPSDYLTVQGNWVRNGITQLLGNVTFNGNGAGKVINNGNYPFYNLIISGTCPYKIVSGSYINGSLNINTGASLETYANSYLYVGGNWTNSGTFTSSTGKVVLNGTGTQAVNGGGSSFYDLDINTGVNCTQSGPLNISRTLNLYGTLDLSGQSLYAGDNSGVDYLNVNGTLNVSGNSTLLMGASSYLQVNSGGILNIVGTDSDNPANITHQSGNYSLDILSGGTLAAKYYNINYIGTNGLYMHSGAILDTTSRKGLWYGSFSNGTSGGQYLLFENEFGSDITIGEVTFNNGPAYNINRTSGSNVITIQDAIGDIGTFEYEKDQNGMVDPNSGLIIWKYLNTYIWTGAIDHNWHDGGNWMTNLVPDNTKSAIIPNVTNFPQITNGVAESKTLTLYKNARLEISKNLDLGADIINSGTVVAIGNPTITVGGNWTGSKGVFTPASSKVLFNAASGNKTIHLYSGSFYDMTISGGSGTYYTLDTLTSIGHDLNILTGTLDASAYNLTVGGNWTANGIFVPGNKTVTLTSASGNTSLNNGTNSFYDLMVNSGSGSGTATFLLGSPLKVSRNFTLKKGTLDVSSDGGTTIYNTTIGNRSIINGGTMIARNSLITVSENWQVSSPGVFTCGTSTVLLNGASGTRSITPGSSPFYNLTINTGGIYRISYNTIVNSNLTIAAGSLDVSTSPSYNITVSGNWINNGTFVPRVGTVIFNGPAQTITNVNGELFYNMTVNNNAGLTLNNNVGVSNTLNLTSGIVTTGLNTLTLGTSTSNAGTLSYTAGTIAGKFQRWINAAIGYLFPVGTASNTELATLNVNSGLTAGSLLMEYNPSNPGSNGLPLIETGRTITNQFTEGYWNATAKNGLVIGNYNVNLKTAGFNSYYFGENTAILKRTNGGNWILDGTHVAAVNPTAYRNNLTGGLSTAGTQFCIGFPDCQGGQIGSDQSVCNTQDVAAFTSIVAPSGAANTFIYTWQLTTNTSAVAGDGNWTDVPGATLATYDPGVISANTRFIRKVNGTGCTSDKFSNIVTITIMPLPTTGPMYRKPNQ